MTTLDLQLKACNLGGEGKTNKSQFCQTMCAVPLTPTQASLEVLLHHSFTDL